MTCVNCQSRIEKQLKNNPGVESASASFAAGNATVIYDPEIIAFDTIKEGIEKLGYKVLEEGKAANSPAQIAGFLALILILYMLIRHLGVDSLSSAFPLAGAGMGLGMIFVIGLLTSVHCAAMCGGINLSQSLGVRTAMPLLPGLLYNAGRVISYTAVGTIAGALGQVVTVGGHFRGVVQLAAGVFMVIMGLNMLGLFPFLRKLKLHLPKFFGDKIDSEKAAGRSPFIVGLLNGLMPCGPLQAMQLYALSSGSPLRGGLSMLVFSLGTVPLMFGIGALSSLLGRKYTAPVLKAGAVLVTVLGLAMFTNGWTLAALPVAGSSIGVKSSSTAGSNSFEPTIVDGFQIVNSTLRSGAYPPITVQQGIPVRWTINAPQGSITGCNNQMYIREYDINWRFKSGENVIEFVPKKAGRFSYSCWMGMIRSSITVVEAGASAGAADIPGTTAQPAAPVPAGVNISAERIAVAEIQEEGWQKVGIKLTDEGFEPSVLVVQIGLPVLWIIDNDSLDPGNGSLLFPAFRARLEASQGENGIQFVPEGDFEFSTGDNIFYGFVKAVDDINRIDNEGIKQELAEFETLIYPDGYFEEAD
ncbi:heavy metal transport/detoxification protein [Leadbettera azotonutricia ZAS-9]|uniref:Heavy metal transport/detoxification protein n=2 Tax=Leadbettera azotonutricia TaxID=150829 RepID=F5Y9G1_LEAAZ|nr:heavy metal transport/detoxification protein [Leadbettera azotonutricia ZAS-9]